MVKYDESAEASPENSELSQDNDLLSTGTASRKSKKTALFNKTIKKHLRNSCGCEIKVVNFLRNFCGVIAGIIKNDHSPSQEAFYFFRTFEKQRKDKTTTEMQNMLRKYEIYEYIANLFALNPRIVFEKLSLKISQNADQLQTDFNFLKEFIEGSFNNVEIACDSMIAQ